MRGWCFSTFDLMFFFPSIIKAKTRIKPLGRSYSGSMSLTKLTAPLGSFRCSYMTFDHLVVTLETRIRAFIENKFPNTTKVQEISSYSLCFVVKTKDVDTHLSI